MAQSSRSPPWAPLAPISHVLPTLLANPTSDPTPLTHAPGPGPRRPPGTHPQTSSPPSRPSVGRPVTILPGSSTFLGCATTTALLFSSCLFDSPHSLIAIHFPLSYLRSPRRAIPSTSERYFVCRGPTRPLPTSCFL